MKEADNQTPKFCSCKTSSKVYAVVNPETNRLHRATFSKSLAEHIVREHYPTYEVRAAWYKRGNKLKRGEKSRGIYGVVGTKQDLLLRVPLRLELAELYTQCDSRHIEEVFLNFI